MDLGHQHEEPPINRAIEDVLAIAGGDESQEAMLMDTMLRICTEKLARAAGRGKCRETLRGLDAFVREAKPVKPWKP